MTVATNEVVLGRLKALISVKNGARHRVSAGCGMMTESPLHIGAGSFLYSGTVSYKTNQAWNNEKHFPNNRKALTCIFGLKTRPATAPVYARGFQTSTDSF